MSSSVQVIKVIHGPNGSLDMEEGCKIAWIWAKIAGSINLLNDHNIVQKSIILWKIESGNQIRFG